MLKDKLKDNHDLYYNDFKTDGVILANESKNWLYFEVEFNLLKI